MPIEVSCTNCSALLRAPDAAAGKKIKCPKCETIVPVPAAGGEAATIKPTPSTAPPPMPVPVLPAAPPQAVVPVGPAPSRRDDEDRPPPRRRYEEDDDRPRRRQRRDESPTTGGSGLPLGLGIGSIAMGVVALIFSFLPCCGFVVALTVGGVGMILALVGVIVALTGDRSGLVTPIIGACVNVAAMLAAVLAYIFIMAAMQAWWDSWWRGANKMMEENRRMMEEQKQKEQKRKEDEYNKNVTDPSFINAKKASQENLKKIAKALLDYEAKNGNLPYFRNGPGGKEGQGPNGLSWRVAILPHLDRKDQYAKFKFNEAWDSPSNRQAAQEMPDVFMSPRHPGEKAKTYYQVFVGEGLFGTQNLPPQTLKLGTRAPDTIFMVVEAGNPVNWWASEDINFNAAFTPDLGGILPGKHFNAALANGEVVFVSRFHYTDEQIRGLIPFNGGKTPPVWPPQQK
jgi:hypothetical protein